LHRKDSALLKGSHHLPHYRWRARERGTEEKEGIDAAADPEYSAQNVNQAKDEKFSVHCFLG
jgi:hypothetical protein